MRDEGFNPEDFLKRVESDDFDPSNLTEEDKEKLALLRYYTDSDAGITTTYAPYE